MISDAVLAQTGQRFLANGLNDDNEQFRYLMDNALTSKTALNLSVGVRLTSEQVAALTHDIVWMEERIVINVIASTAKAEGNLTADAGRDLTLASADDEHNVETNSKDGKKRIHEEDNHTVQKAAEFSAGGNVMTRSGGDTTLIASKISAGNEAYVYAGNDLNLLAARTSLVSRAGQRRSRHPGRGLADAKILERLKQHRPAELADA